MSSYSSYKPGVYCFYQHFIFTFLFSDETFGISDSTKLYIGVFCACGALFLFAITILIAKLTCFNENELRRYVIKITWFRFMVFNATFNNISVISCRLVLLVEETGVPDLL
jgi:hypothetical protein